MSLQIRRVVTGHHANGKAKVLIDEVVTNVKLGRPGATVHAIGAAHVLGHGHQRDDGFAVIGRHVFEAQVLAELHLLS